MPRKGENIYKRKDGRWEGRYIRSYDSEHKAKYAYVYGKTYSEVKRKLTEQRGNVQKVQPTKNKSSTYGELLDCCAVCGCNDCCNHSVWRCFYWRIPFPQELHSCV